MYDWIWKVEKVINQKFEKFKVKPTREMTGKKDVWHCCYEEGGVERGKRVRKEINGYEMNSLKEMKRKD